MALPYNNKNKVNSSTGYTIKSFKTEIVKKTNWQKRIFRTSAIALVNVFIIGVAVFALNQNNKVDFAGGNFLAGKDFILKDVSIPRIDKSILNTVSTSRTDLPKVEEPLGLGTTMTNIQSEIDKNPKVFEKELPTVNDPSWKIVGSGDVNKDGSPDLFWRHQKAGANVVWYMNGNQLTSIKGLPTVKDVEWKIVGVSDFNTDESPDLLWRYQSPIKEVFMVWHLEGEKYKDVTDFKLNLSESNNWDITDVTDFDADGFKDLILSYNGSNTEMRGANLVYYLKNTKNGIEDKNDNNSEWLPWDTKIDEKGNRMHDILGIRDFNGDGFSDMVLRRNQYHSDIINIGQMFVLLLNKNEVFSEAPFIESQSLDWQPFFTDIDNNKLTDIYWFNSTKNEKCSGKSEIWMQNNLFRESISSAQEFSKCD